MNPQSPCRPDYRTGREDRLHLILLNGNIHVITEDTVD